jgi:very-short-patch-repair endonuclease
VNDIGRPWLSENHDRDHGREEIVGPGGFDHLANIAEKEVLRNKKALELSCVCESPIELELGSYLLIHLKDPRLTLVPQHPWRGFRMDFALMRDGLPVLFIECDGREWHSTQTQLERDARKNAAADSAGIPLIRFTGSEIFKNANGIARLVASQARQS